MNKNNEKLIISFSIVIIFSLGFFFWTVAQDLGVSSDSVVYIEAARSLIAGKGYQIYEDQIIHYPPAYSSLLSLVGILHHDMLQSARWLHAFLFTTNLILVGVITYLATGKSVLVMLSSILLFISSASLLEIHSMVWSEVPFLTFSLGAFLFLALYIKNHHSWMLLLSGIFLGLATVTRYVGITLLPAMIACLIFNVNRRIKLRIRDSVVLLTMCLIPYLLVFLRNFIVAGNPTSREFSIHLVGAKHIKGLINTLYNFWFPIDVNVKYKAVFLALGIFLLVAGSLIVYTRGRQNQQEASIFKSLNIFTMIFIVTYISFVLFSISFLTRIFL
ncbi:glycosyltransferase family 39 protein [Chloroflexota bacterium]